MSADNMFEHIFCQSANVIARQTKKVDVKVQILTRDVQPGTFMILYRQHDVQIPVTIIIKEVDYQFFNV